MLVAATAAPAPASAVEFRLDGMWRLRADLYDTLSLERGEERDEVRRHFIDQRLRLVPHLRINAGVHLYLDIDVFGG